MIYADNREATVSQYIEAIKQNLEHLDDSILDKVTLVADRHCQGMLCTVCPFPQLNHGSPCHPSRILNEADLAVVEKLITSEYERRDRLLDRQMSAVYAQNRTDHLTTQVISYIEVVAMRQPHTLLRALGKCYCDGRTERIKCTAKDCPLCLHSMCSASLLTKEQAEVIRTVLNAKAKEQREHITRSREIPDIPNPHDILAANKTYPGFADSIFRCTADRMNQMPPQCTKCALPSVQRKLCTIPRLSSGNVLTAYNYACEAKNTLDGDARKIESNEVALSGIAKQFAEHIKHTAECLVGSVLSGLYQCWREGRAVTTKLKECHRIQCPLCGGNRCYAARLSDTAARILEGIFVNLLDNTAPFPLRTVIKLSSEDSIDADIISNISCD